MPKLFGRATEPLPAELSAEDALRAACVSADAAARDLSQALWRRRAALVALSARTLGHTGHKAQVNQCFSPQKSWRALAHHGLDTIIGLPVIPPKHRSSFTAQAEAVISASAAGRPSKSTAPAAPAELQKESA